MYVGVTDQDWFEILKQERCDEVNFWTPGGRNFKQFEKMICSYLNYIALIIISLVGDSL